MDLSLLHRLAENLQNVLVEFGQLVQEEDAVVGEAPEQIDDLSRWGVAVVASGITVGKGAKVLAKGMIEEDVKAGEEVDIHA